MSPAIKRKEGNDEPNAEALVAHISPLSHERTQPAAGRRRTRSRPSASTSNQRPRKRLSIKRLMRRKKLLTRPWNR